VGILESTKIVPKASESLSEYL